MNKNMNEFLDDVLGDEPQLDISNETKANVVAKVMTNDKLADVLDNDGYTVDLSEAFPYIPLDWIRVRKVNDYSKSNIPALAENIKKLGLLNPIIVVAEIGDDGKRYTISDGERRFTAMSMLYEQAKQSGDPDQIAKYGKIRARILTSEQMEVEEQIHRSANDMARDNTIYERIFRYHPSLDFFEKEENRRTYVQLAYGEDGWQRLEEGLLRVKFDAKDIRKCVALMCKRDFPGIEIGYDTVRKYVTTIIESDPALTKAVMDCIVTPKASIKLSKLDKPMQRQVVELVRQGVNVNDATNQVLGISSDKPVKEVDVETDDTKEVSDLDIIKSTSKALYRQLDRATQLNGIKGKGLTGNQKEQLKQIKKILKQIEVLQSLPD